MLYYDRIDVSEGIDVNKTSKTKEHNICSCFYFFLKKGFKFQSYLCSRCHDLVVMMSMSLNNIAILSIKDFIFFYNNTFTQKV